MNNNKYSDWASGINESDDEDEVQEDYRYSKSATLWCIEATATMLAPFHELNSAAAAGPTPSGSARPNPTQAASIAWKGAPARSKMEVILRAAYSTMKRKVVSSPKDLVGITVWNVEKGHGAETTGQQHNFSFCLLPLQQVDAKSIKFLKGLLEQAEEDPHFLARMFKPNEGQNIAPEVIGHANSDFRTLSAKAHNTMFLVTDNDDPIGINQALLRPSMIKRNDFHEMGYAIEPFLIPPVNNGDFDVGKYWGEVLTHVPDEEADTVSWPTVNRNLRESLESMVESMRTKEAAKRVAFKIPFVIGKELVIGVAGYNTIGEETKKPATKVDLHTAAGEEVISKTVYKDDDTGHELNPKVDIKKYFQVGRSDPSTSTQAAKIFFTEEDIRKVKTIGRPPSLKLLGFKPKASSLHFSETIKHSYFIYPDEDRYTGSTRTFAALLKSMLEKEVVGFAAFVARSTSKPQVVILLPQEEKLNAAGVAVQPPGMHICQLPFVDDKRDLGLDMTVSVLVPPENPDDLDDVPEQPAVDLAKKIIGKYSKKYNPDLFPNPALNYFYETLAAVALDEEIPLPEDKTVPAYAVIDERIGKYISSLKSLIPEDSIDSSRLATSTKKRPPGVKKEEKEVDLEELEEFVELWREKGAKMTIPMLREGLRKMQLPLTGKKDDLLLRVETYLRSRGLIPAGDDVDDDDDGMAVDSDAEEEKPKKSQSSASGSGGGGGKKKKKPKVVEDSDSDGY